MSLLRIYMCFLAFGLILVSCNGNSETEEKPKGNNQVARVDELDVQFGTEGDEKPELPKHTDKRVIDPKILEEYLPKHIKGYERYPASFGTSSDVSSIWSSASTEYVYMKKGFISIAIFDYGKNGNIPDRKLYEQLPDEIGYESYKIEINNGKGYLLWNNETRSGNLGALIDDRFTIIMKADNIKPGVRMDEYLQKVDIDGLIKLGNK